MDDNVEKIYVDAKGNRLTRSQARRYYYSSYTVTGYRKVAKNTFLIKEYVGTNVIIRRWQVKLEQLGIKITLDILRKFLQTLIETLKELLMERKFVSLTGFIRMRLEKRAIPKRAVEQSKNKNRTHLMRFEYRLNRDFAKEIKYTPLLSEDGMTTESKTAFRRKLSPEEFYKALNITMDDYITEVDSDEIEEFDEIEDEIGDGDDE